ncbi:AI-2E family transporter [Siphonobacter curvatus]|uniref:AI-2E family transporter n=1 Tax=Siphonobacter curvatus TaxID=2094562 RepID=A0A2S7ILZ7_9BACT|nr:AI-2E family transporter [Siphonobacter curvatus]PQA58580.1 AI-2E family transporter [Siphonobacter curvatus]
MPASDRPFYHRASHSLIIISLVTLGIYIGQEIIVPLALGGLLAILLRPVEAWFMRRGVHKVIAICLTLALAVIVLSGVAVFISIQISNFSDDLPKLQDNINDFYRTARRWVRQEYNVSYTKQAQYIKQAQQKTLENLQGGTGALAAISGPLGTLALIPIYVFLLLYYRAMLLKFLVSLFMEEHAGRVWEIIGQVKAVIQSYVVGLLLETACVAILNALGLLALGVEYAIMLSVIAAILNLIPYLGGIIATVLAVAIVFINNPEPSMLLGVVGVFLAVQFIDNNFLVPMIVGSKVKVNALVSIVGVLIGGALAGVSGMFLSIPAIALMKVIFDRVEGLEPWGILIGDDQPDDAKQPMLPRWMRIWERRKAENG